MAKKNWREIKKGDAIFNFKDNSVLFLEFLNDGEYFENKEITLNDGTKSVIKEGVDFDVMNIATNENGKFSANSKGLIEDLAGLTKDLKGKRVRIEHIKGRKDVDNTYKVSLITEKQIKE